MKRLLQEPLLHFLLLGAGLFVAYSLIPGSGGGEPGKIVITQGQLESMVVGYARTRQRPPTVEELKGLIRDRVREEVYYREALALGLDKDDLIIRRRLLQKMAFLTDDLVAQVPPTDAELEAYLQAHPDQFRVEPRFTFRQLFLDPEKHGAHLARDAAQLLGQLNQAGGRAAESARGDPLMLEHRFDALPASEVGRQFGRAFADRLGELAPGRWQGPVESSYGMHLVLVSQRVEGRLPALAEVRDAVSREWTNARRLEESERKYADLLKRYSVIVEPPQAAARSVEPTVAR
jgi:hypothetical protein